MSGGGMTYQSTLWDVAVAQGAAMPVLAARSLDLPDADVVFFPQIFSAADSAQWLAALLAETPWKQDYMEIQGRAVPLPRLTAWYGDRAQPYTYSTITLRPKTWTPTLRAIKTTVEALTQHRYTSVLLNLYRDGQDSVSWHSDNETELGQLPVIASVSFGATRRFSLKHKFRKDLARVDLDLTPGSLLLMAGPTQKYWLHQVPKTRKPVGQRVNLTFRIVRQPGS